jgi:glutaredoxin
MKRVAIMLLAAALLATPVSCKRHSDDGTSPDARALPALDLRDDTQNLLLTWIDAKGDFHTSMAVPDVPLEGRDAVRVVVTTKDDGAATELVYVANLTQKKPDGSYMVGTMTRAEWDAVAERRRAPKLAEAAPHAQTPPKADDSLPQLPGDGPTKVTVIIYGASWCGPCHEAQAHLKKKGVPVVFHDIEKEESAAAEMQKKLARAGMHGGSIPVIDVGGKLLVGYSESALDSALAQASQNGTPM